MKQFLNRKIAFNSIFILPVISGILLVFTLPPFNISIFLWFFCVPLLFFIDSKKIKTKQVFQGGFIVGIIYFTKVLYPLLSLNAWWWLDIRGIIYENRIIFLFWVLYFVLLYASLFFGIFAILYKKLRKHNFIDILTFPFIWILFEFIRAQTVLGFTWGHIGYGLHNNIYILQTAKIFGVYGLGFLILTINILIYLILRNIKYDYSSLKIRFKHFFIKNYYLYLLIIIISISMSYGFFSIKKQDKYFSNISVAVIQTGLNTENSTTNSFKYVMKLLIEATSKHVNLVILPENVFPYFIFDKISKKPIGYFDTNQKIKKMYDNLLKLSGDNKNISFVFGAYSSYKDKKYNSMLVLENKKIISIYDKRYLMPFSETKILFFNPIESMNTDRFSSSNKLTKVKNVFITPLICSEIIFPKLSRNNTSSYIINIGNDGVFNNKTVLEQNHIIAKLRAVENNEYVLRAMKTGISSIINNHGVAINRTKNNKESILYFSEQKK